jgi:hypothetical protein
MMDERDELRDMLGRWRAPETPVSLEARLVRELRNRRVGWWRRFMEARIEIPAPVLAAALVILAAAVWMVRPAPAPRVQPTPAVVVTTFDASGFEPLTDGAVRLIRGEVRQ